jgi:chromosome segregation ATPase
VVFSKNKKKIHLKNKKMSSTNLYDLIKSKKQVEQQNRQLIRLRGATGLDIGQARSLDQKISKNKKAISNYDQQLNKIQKQIQIKKQKIIADREKQKKILAQQLYQNKKKLKQSSEQINKLSDQQQKTSDSSKLDVIQQKRKNLDRNINKMQRDIQILESRLGDQYTYNLSQQAIKQLLKQIQQQKNPSIPQIQTPKKTKSSFLKLFSKK